MNIENIRRLALKMRRLRHEEHYDQGEWVRQTSCGTAACLAGHAAMLAGAKLKIHACQCGCGGPSGGPGYSCNLDGKDNAIADVARKFLGLTNEQASLLFSASPATAWPSEFRTRWVEAKFSLNNERPSRIAADLLTALADGKVKLGSQR